MKISILEDRFLHEIKEFVEMNNIINVLSNKIDEIKKLYDEFILIRRLGYV